MVQCRPFCGIEDFPPKSKVPVCSTCKKTNRTRSFCRDRHKHRKLPWCTVYVMLSTQESADPSTVSAAPSTKFEGPRDENTMRKTNTLDSSTAAIQNCENISVEQNTEVGKTKDSGSDFDINDIPESRTMLIQINDESIVMNWLKRLPEDESSSRGVWAPQPQVATQEQKCSLAGTAIIQGAQGPNLPHAPVAPSTVRIPKREADSLFLHPPTASSLDSYNRHSVGPANLADGQSISTYHGTRKRNEPSHHPYPYNPLTPLHKDTAVPPQYTSHLWPYPNTAIPSHSASHPHPYVTVPESPISPAPDIASPGATSRGSPRSPTVTAGEAAAMRRKKPRREFEPDGKHESQRLDLSPSPPVSTVPQLQRPLGSYSQVPIASGHPPAGPPPMHPSQHHSSQVQSEQQPWMAYHPMYQPQLQPMGIQYYNDPTNMALRTPENNSRSLQHNDESPNNVTMTPGPGDGGGDHDSDDNDFNRRSLH
ncbi:unnamed protein product [Pseudo-nitzschia multistriata]|uniref:Uncharacterized protein n=1 Tax=Pseudo-nitzschia multistriata TaxID=183589 RepID=A0A448Z3K4_9STRA|nr:unnamed protein product [Pseudo-nitzschia multistriata]